jgi:hypothetical protein
MRKNSSIPYNGGGHQWFAAILTRSPFLGASFGKAGAQSFIIHDNKP